METERVPLSLCISGARQQLFVLLSQRLQVAGMITPWTSWSRTTHTHTHTHTHTRARPQARRWCVSSRRAGWPWSCVALWVPGCVWFTFSETQTSVTHVQYILFLEHLVSRDVTENATTVVSSSLGHTIQVQWWTEIHLLAVWKVF